MQKIKWYKYRMTRFKRIFIFIFLKSLVRKYKGLLLTGHEAYHMVESRHKSLLLLVSTFSGKVNSFFSLQYQNIVSGSTVSEGGLIDPEEKGAEHRGRIRPTEGLEIPRLLFFNRGVVSSTRGSNNGGACVRGSFYRGASTRIFFCR